MLVRSTSSVSGADSISATRSALGGVTPKAIWAGIWIPAPRRERASLLAASFAGSEEKPLELLLPRKPALKERPERGPM